MVYDYFKLHDKWCLVFERFPIRSSRLILILIKIFIKIKLLKANQTQSFKEKLKTGDTNSDIVVRRFFS